MPHVEDPRRAPRLSAHCRVEVRDRYASWEAETEDLGPRGCQLLTGRPVSVGDVLTLQISSALMPAPLVVLGLVAWSRPGPEGRIGIAFAGAALTSSLSPEQWFTRLVASDPTARVRDARRTVPLETVLYLAAPPAERVALSRDEARLLRGIGHGKSIAALSEVAESGSLRRALFSLLSRRLVTPSRASAVEPARWEALIEEAELADAAAEIARTRPPTPEPSPVVRRGPDAQRLYQRAVELLVGGNAVAAEALVRSAADAAPDDPVLKNVLKRFTRQ